jgi:hypothetical protein
MISSAVLALAAAGFGFAIAGGVEPAARDSAVR